MNDTLYTERGLRDAVQLASELGIEVDDDVARAICSAWHGGQASPFYSFASSGHYDRAALLSELSSIIAAEYYCTCAAERLALDMLGTYLINREA